MDFSEIFNMIINGGGTGVMLYLIIDMRREAKADRAQIWELLAILLKQQRPDLDVPPLPSQRAGRNGP